MNKIYLFVYGTLKKDCKYNYKLKNSKFIDLALTKEKYAMYISDYPLVIKNKKISYIKGEVYEVSQKTLNEIDEFEEHPEVYYREKIKIKLVNSNKELEAWIYFYPKPEGYLIKDGEYKCNQ